MASSCANMSAPPQAASHYLVDGGGYSFLSLRSRDEVAELFESAATQNRSGDLERGFSYYMVQDEYKRWHFEVNVSPVPNNQLAVARSRLRLPALEETAA
jgi:hypothetical protein